MWVKYIIKDNGTEIPCDKCENIIQRWFDPTATAWLDIDVSERLVVDRVLCDPCYQRDHGEGAKLPPITPLNNTDATGLGEPVLTAGKVEQ